MFLRRGLKLISFRYFSVIEKSIHPTRDLIRQIEQTSNIINLIKKEKFGNPDYLEHSRILKDLEETAIVRSQDFNNLQLMNCLKYYVTADQGSEKLFSALTYQIYKRIHSFTSEELSNLIYFASNTKLEDRLYDVIDNLLIKDAFKITFEMAGKIAIAYGTNKKGSDTLWRIIASIFITQSEKLDIENGLKIITGVYNKEYKDFDLLRVIEDWGVKNADKMDSAQIAQLFYSLIKLESSDEVLSNVENSFQYEKLESKDSEKLLGCYIHKKRELPNRHLLDCCLKFIKSGQINPSELIQFIHSLSRFNDTDLHFKEIEKLVMKTIDTFSIEEIVYLFVALIKTGKETSNLLSVFRTQFERDIEKEYYPLLYTSLLRRGNLFKDTVEPILKKTQYAIRGNALDTSTFIIVLYSLLQLKYDNLQFWEKSLRSVRNFDLKSPDEYIQIYKIVQKIGEMGIDNSEALSYLSNRYESNN